MACHGNSGGWLVRRTKEQAQRRQNQEPLEHPEILKEVLEVSHIHTGNPLLKSLCEGRGMRLIKLIYAKQTGREGRYDGKCFPEETAAGHTTTR
jgi:hypothetical protein